MRSTVDIASAHDVVGTSRNEAPDDFVLALRTACESTDPDTAAAGAERVIDALSPLLTRVAAIYAASWPAPSVDTVDLLHDAVAAVLAGLPQAPRHSRAVAMAWFSAEVFRALHAARAAATSETGNAQDTLLTDHRLRDVFGALSTRDADVLRLRSAGACWADVGLYLGVSPGTARRTYARALAAARAAALTLRHAA